MREKDILAYHYGLISGIQTVDRFAPRILLPAKLPLVMLFADALETYSRSGNRTTKYRTLRAVLFAEEVGFGTATTGYEKTDPFFSSVEDYFEPRPTLALADGTTEFIHEYQNDSGETMTPYPTGKDTESLFWTITFLHRFTIVKEVVYQSGL